MAGVVSGMLLPFLLTMKEDDKTSSRENLKLYFEALFGLCSFSTTLVQLFWLRGYSPQQILEINTKKKLKNFDLGEIKGQASNTVLTNYFGRTGNNTDEEESKGETRPNKPIDKEIMSRRMLKFLENDTLKLFNIFSFFQNFIGNKSYFYLLGISALTSAVMISYYLNFTILVSEFGYSDVSHFHLRLD